MVRSRRDDTGSGDVARKNALPLAKSFSSRNSMKTPEAIALDILKLIFRYRRMLPGVEECGQSPCHRCLEQHLPRVLYYVWRNEPVHFILPAFPCKSANRAKVLGERPDMAERTALEFLEKICRRIQQNYPPGARITIC